MTDKVNTNDTIDEETFKKQKAFFKENLIKQFREQEAGFDNVCIEKVENLLNYHGQECSDMQSYVSALHTYLTDPGTRFIDANTAKQLAITEKFCKKYIEQTQDFVGDFSKLPFEQQKEIVKNSLIRNATQNGATRSTLNEIKETCDLFDNEKITDIDSYLSKLYQKASYKGAVIFDADKDNSGYWPAMTFLENNLKPMMAYTNFPQAPEPEPVIEIDPKKKEKIENWMKAVGLEDKVDEMIQAYGDKAYAVVQNAMANPKNMAEITDGTYRNSKNTLLYLLENKETMKEKVGDVDVLTIAGEKKRTLDNFNDSFMDELSKRGTAIPKEGYASLLAALKTTPNTYADLLMAMDRVANERGFDKEKVKETKDLLTDFYENKYQDVMKNNTSVKKLEKGIIIPEVNEMVGLNIETPKIELPEKIGELPGYDLSKADMDRVKYASAMLGELKINGIDDAKMAEAINKAFKESMRIGWSDMEAWRGNFRYNLTQELDLERKAKGDKDKYAEMMKALAGTDKMVAESLDTLPNNKVEYLSFVDTVNKVNLAKDIADIKPEIAENADTKEKVEKVKTRVSTREKIKAGYNRVLAFVGLKKKEKADSDVNQENSATQTVETQTIDLTLLGDALKSKDAGK